MSVVTKDTIQPSSGQALTIKDEGGTASITVATNGEATFAENVILTANKGLSFQNHSVSSVTGASSTTSDNVLDDYEEGTWTPVVTDGSTNATMNAGSTGGVYTKIGNAVFIGGRATSSSITGCTGGVRIINLPFNVKDGQGGYASVSVGEAKGFDIGSGQAPALTIQYNTTRMHVDLNNSGVGTSQMQFSNWTDDGYIMFSGVYFV